MEQGEEARCSDEETFTAEYKMMMTLGRGQFSEVKRAFHIPTVSWVAVKILRNQKKYASLIKSEINIMKSLTHPNIIKLFHVVQTRETTYLVMEHASEGDLLHHILDLGHLEESKARRLFTQILHAVQYCHDNFIIHRDIKAQNILLDHKGNAKLCDFGLSAKVIPGQRLGDFCGTLPYCAPELFGKEAYDGRATDIWSLGVLLFFMVTGRFPFNAYSDVRVIQQILDANFRVPPYVSVDIRDVILKLLIKNPYRRLTIGQIMRHPMVRNSEAHSPPTFPQSLPGTLSPGIVRAMTIMGYKSEEIIESLRDQKYNQVMATYLILQHQSPRGDCFHHQEKPMRAMQSGLVLNLADLHTFPVCLGRATKPARPTFTLPPKTNEKEEKSARQGGTRHSMSAALCCQPKKTHPPHLPHLGCPVADSLVGSNLEITEYFTQTEIGSLSSHMASVQPPHFLDTSSPRPHQSETTGDRDNNVSSCSSQEELCSSQEASQYFTPTGSFLWDTLQEETITQGSTTTQEGTMAQDKAITHEVTMTQDEAITHEVTMTQDEAITHEVTMSQDEAITHEVTMMQDEAITLEVTMTQDEAITHEVTMSQDEAITQATMSQNEAITHGATMTQEGTMNQDEAITHEVTMTQDEAITHEMTMTKEVTMNQDEAITP
ncbi:sperm motility kinase 2B-like [Onychomys torridus]|uniref:sperm motility kinase 2B-like n=1 Tax=Onychomys torridus TaxID=38674 RepID=UPI00167F466A|nr:sperm motility kinase 2B-like [Onychomys torridus]